MGQKLAKSYGVSPDKYHKPRGLYPNCDVDLKKLKKSIVTRRLAPCFPGAEDESDELEECPICLLHYPALNKTRCCSKGLCTECYLQVQFTSREQELCLCPYCKACLHVGYRGPLSSSEKSAAKVEQQRIFEAILKARVEEEKQSQERAKNKQKQPAEPRLREEHTDGNHTLKGLTSRHRDAGSRGSFKSISAGRSLSNAQRQAQFVDMHLAAYIPPDILLDSGGLSAEMDLNDVMLMHAVCASMDDFHKGDRGRQTSSDSVQPLEPVSPHCQRDPTIHEALQEGLLDTATSDNNLTSTGKIIISANSVSNMLDTGASEPSTTGAADSQTDTARQAAASHSGNSGNLRSGEWATANPHSTLSTVSSTSMEVLLSAAADFGSGLLDTGGSLRDRDGQGLPSSPRDGPDRALAATTGKAVAAAGTSPGAASSIAISARAPTEAEPSARAHVPRSEITSLPPIAEADTELKSASGLLAADRQATASTPAHLPAHASSLLRWQLGRAAPLSSRADDSTVVSGSRSEDTEQSAAASEPQQQPVSASDAGSLKRVTWDIPTASTADQQAEAGESAQQHAWAEHQAVQQQQQQQHAERPDQQQKQQMQELHDHHRQPHAPQLPFQRPATPFSSSRIPFTPGPHDVHVGMAFTDFLPWPRSRGRGSMPCSHHCSLCPEPHDTASGTSRHAGSQPAQLSQQQNFAPHQSGWSPGQPAQHESARQPDLSSAAASSQDNESASDLVLSADGGAVLMQDPDGTQHFVLLVSDLQKLAKAQEQAAANLLSAAGDATYQPPTSAHDAAVRAAIARSDELLQQLYAQPGVTNTSGQSEIAAPVLSAAEESWLERMRREDEALTASLNSRDGAHGHGANL